MNNCTSCGGSFQGDPFVKTWKCEYCGQINYNKEFLQRHIQAVDTARVSNLMQVAVVSYQSGEYLSSLGAFEKVLQEDSDNLDAWVYAALSAAQTINLTNFDDLIPKVDNYLKQAEKIGADSDVFLVGRNVANELICSVLLRGAQMRFEEAKKADFAYSSVDDKYAKSKANEQIRIMMSYAEAAMRLPINNPTLQCEVASSVIQGIKFYSGESPYSELLNKATSVILGFKETNLTLFNKYAGLLKAPSRKNQGCMSLFATSSDKKRPLIGKPVKILLITVGSLLALLIIAALISEKHTQEAVTYYQRGVAYYEKGNPDEAISNFNKAIEIDPNTTDAYGFRGVIFREKGNFDQAILDISKAIENNSNPAPQLYYNRGIAYREKGNFEQAILDFNRTIEKDPGFSDAYVSRGFVHYKKGNLEQAISDLDKAIEINPKDAKVYVSRGVFHSEKGNFDQAILDCNKAIKINSKYAPAYYNRGIAYREKGNLDKAISDFSKAIEIDSTFANAYYHLGKVYFMKKNYSKSWDNIHKAEELGCKIISPEFLIDLKNASGRER